MLPSKAESRPDLEPSVTGSEASLSLILVINVDLEPRTVVGSIRSLQREGIVKGHRTEIGNGSPHPDTHVTMDFIGAKFKRARVDETDITKDGPTHLTEDREGGLRSAIGRGVASQHRTRHTVSRSDIPGVETPEVTCTPEHLPVENRNPPADGIHHRHGSIEVENDVPGQVPVLGTQRTERVSLDITSENPPSPAGPKVEAVPAARQHITVPAVVDIVG